MINLNAKKIILFSTCTNKKNVHVYMYVTKMLLNMIEKVTVYVPNIFKKNALPQGTYNL